MDAQQAHDNAMVDPKDWKLNLGSKERLEALLRAKNASGEPPPSRESERPAPREAIAQAMNRHPDLTREDAEEVALVFGF